MGLEHGETEFQRERQSCIWVSEERDVAERTRGWRQRESITGYGRVYRASKKAHERGIRVEITRGSGQAVSDIWRRLSDGRKRAH